jgi:hypothetical protein
MKTVQEYMNDPRLLMIRGLWLPRRKSGSVLMGKR